MSTSCWGWTKVARRRWYIIGGLFIIVMGLGMGLWWRWQGTRVILDPQARIDPDRNYVLEVWVEIPSDPPRPPVLDDPFWRALTEDFQSRYSHVRIEWKALSFRLLPEEMKKATRQGKPPDVLIYRTEWPRLWSNLQLPLDNFLSSKTREQYFTVALAAASIGDKIMAWPSQIHPRVGAANRAWLSEAGFQLPDLVERLSRSGEGREDEWEMLLDRLKKVRNLRQAPVAYQGGTGELLYYALLADSGGILDESGRLLITAGRIKAIISARMQWEERGLIEGINGHLLTDFFTGKRAVIAPVGEWIWSLVEKARRRGYYAFSSPSDIVLLPLPLAGEGATWLPARMVQVAVFRHRKFRGPAQARLAMELAEMLSKRLGLQLSVRGWGLPASRALLACWRADCGLLPQQAENLIQLAEEATGIPPLPPQQNEIRYRIAADILKPGCKRYAAGEMGIEVAEIMETEMRALLTSVFEENERKK